MAKKKKLKMTADVDVDFSQEELDYIRFKMNPGDPMLRMAEPIPYVDYGFSVDIKCKNAKQKQYLNLLKDDSKQIVAALGEPGTGKSWVSLAYGLQCIKTGKFRQIVCFNPTAPAGAKALEIGFLPGSMDDKIFPFVSADRETMKAILDESGNPMSAKIVDGLIRNKVIEHRVVNYARGCTINNALILINEAQNFSYEELCLLIGRIGGRNAKCEHNPDLYPYGSKIILSGDIRQLDRSDIRKSGKKASILEIVEKLSDMEEFGRVDFERDDIVRNPLITKILDRLDPNNEKLIW